MKLKSEATLKRDKPELRMWGMEIGSFATILDSRHRTKDVVYRVSQNIVINMTTLGEDRFWRKTYAEAGLLVEYLSSGDSITITIEDS